MKSRCIVVPKFVPWLVFAFSVLLRITGLCADQSSGLRITMDIPDSLGNRYPNHKDYPTADRFLVVIENTSSQAVFIPKEDDVNRALLLEVTTKVGETSTLHQIPREYTKYVADQLRLGPGEATVCEVFYGNQPGDYPLRFPHDPNQKDSTRKVTIRAVFEQAPFANATAGTWTGKAVSEPHEVELMDDFE